MEEPCRCYLRTSLHHYIVVFLKFYVIARGSVLHGSKTESSKNISSPKIQMFLRVI